MEYTSNGIMFLEDSVCSRGATFTLYKSMCLISGKEQRMKI